ncbi:unnamed protein product [Tenebrio molitor]|nr:unnamed protein product [Tenebrio molitor]
MLPRRRRAGSETEPLVVVSNDNSWSKQSNLTYVNSAYPNNVPQDYYLEDDLTTEDYTEPEPVMAARDRTSEFVNTIQTLQGRSIARAVAVRDPKKSKVIQSHSEFMLIAKNIGRNIASTYAKLEKLTLCKMAAYEIKNLPELVRPMLGESEFIGASVAKLTSAGDNYCSLIYAVDITVKDGKEEKILHGVAKMLPQNEYVQKLFNSPRIYFNEVGYYETIVPCLRNFQKEQGFTQLLSSVPDFYGARFSLDPSSDRIDEDAVLLIKNIKAEGFSIIDRRVGFDLVQSELVLEKVAELHSTSIALKLHKPEVFEEKLGPFFQEFQMYVADKTAHENVTKSMLDLIKGDKFCFDNLEKIKDNFNESSSHATTRNDKTFSSPFMSLVHNDMWTNNIMVKIVDGKTVDVKFVDYQIYEYSSLARDVIFFLFNSVQLPVIKEHCDHLLAYYHGQLIKYLKKLKCDVSPFGFEAFLSELQNVAKRLEFFHLILMLRPTWAEDADSTEMENISKKDFQKEKPASEKCKQKGYFIVHEFMRRGWI